MFAPIWLEPGLCVCSEGVPVPPEATASLRLVQSESFGTGGHPVSRGAIGALRRVRPLVMKSEARVLDFGAGTGLLSFYAKKIASGDEVVACVDPSDFDTLKRNESLNGELDEVMMPRLFSDFAQREFWVDYFDIVITQAGSRHMVPTLEALEQVTHPLGWLIFTGHTPHDHKFLVHRIAEFFEVTEINDEAGWPVIVAEPLMRTSTEFQP